MGECRCYEEERNGAAAIGFLRILAKREETMDAAARKEQCTANPVLFMAMELSNKKWKLAFGVTPVEWTG